MIGPRGGGGGGAGRFGGGGGGTGGMRFTLLFNAATQNTQQIQQLSGMLQNVLQTMQQLSQVNLQQMRQGIHGAATDMYHFQAALEHTGHRLLGFGKAYASMTFGLFAQLAHESSELEQFIIRLQSTRETSKKDALDIFNATLKATTHLPITEAQLVRVATTFKQRGMDVRDAFGTKTYNDIAAAGGMVEDMAHNMGELGQKMPTVLDLFADLATTQGQLGAEDIGKFVREFSEFMATGQTRFLRTRLDPHLLHELNTTGKTAAGAMDTIFKYLSERNAVGVGRLAMTTFSGIITNFKGLPQRIANAVFQPGIFGGLAQRFAMALSDAFERLNAYFDEDTEKGRKFLSVLRSLFGFIGNTAIKAINALVSAFEKFANFASDNPALMKVVLVLTTLTAAITSMFGAFMLFKAAIIGFKLASAALGSVSTLGLFGGGVGIAKLLGGLAVLATLLMIMRPIIEKTATLFEAMSEALDNSVKLADGGRIWFLSEDTKRKLESSGMSGFFERLLDTYFRVDEAMRSGSSFFDALFPRLGKFIDMLQDVGNGILNFIGDLLGVKDPAKDVQDDAQILIFKLEGVRDKVLEAGKVFREDFVDALTFGWKAGIVVAGVLGLVAIATDSVTAALAGAISMFAVLTTYVLKLAGALMYLGGEAAAGNTFFEMGDAAWASAGKAEAFMKERYAASQEWGKFVVSDLPRSWDRADQFDQEMRQDRSRRTVGDRLGGSALDQLPFAGYGRTGNDLVAVRAAQVSMPETTIGPDKSKPVTVNVNTTVESNGEVLAKSVLKSLQVRQNRAGANGLVAVDLRGTAYDVSVIGGVP